MRVPRDVAVIIVGFHPAFRGSNPRGEILFVFGFDRLGRSIETLFASARRLQDVSYVRCLSMRCHIRFFHVRARLSC